jgi:hypothetical protein
MVNVVDLQSFLESWPYDAVKNARVEHGVDGREIILVRQPMGLEQYELDGRPDGRQVHGMDTLLDFHHARVNAAKQTQSATVLELTAEDCAQLFDETSAYYHRLIVLFRLNDWTRVERDTAQILRLLEFVKQHARCEEDRLQLDPLRPHITRINAVARAMILLDKRQYRDAFQTARDFIGIPATVDEAAPDHGKLAEALLDSVRDSLANHPGFQTHEESSFVRQGDYWTIRYHGHTAFLKATRGLQCLACLLRTPGREFHVSELLANLLEAPVAASEAIASGRLREDGGHCTTARRNDGSPILDAQAKAEYKRRLNELRQDLGEAEQFNDPGRAAKTQDEMNAIAQHLASAIGLGGRDRKTSSEAERARCAVTKRVKQAIQRIGDANSLLGHHLTARIRTGYFCSYNPHPDRPVAWKF